MSKIVGEISESVFLSKALQFGVSVSCPWGDCQSYDFIVDNFSKLYKVQVKTATKDHRKNNVYRVKCSKGSKVKVKYSNKEVDILACYIVDTGDLYLIPIEFIKSMSVGLYPGVINSVGQYEKFKNNWDVFNE